MKLDNKAVEAATGAFIGATKGDGDSTDALREFPRGIFDRAIRAALLAYLEAVDGVVVPREPTAAMIEAAECSLAKWRATLDADERMLRRKYIEGLKGRYLAASATPEEKHAIRYTAMIAAAQEPQP